MYRTIPITVMLAVLGMLMTFGCATSGGVADDEFGGGPELPPLLAERPTPGDGASLYGAHCGRCHTERWPTERTDAQWKTVMLHMRGIGVIPGEDQAAILDYLRSSN